MKTTSKEVIFQGVPVISMTAGGYEALIAPTVGSNIIKLQQHTKKIDFFRYDKKHTMRKLIANPEIYGFPTLYLPNRLNRGTLRTSDALYHFPINEPFYQNHLHGFLHKRKHTVIETSVKENMAIAKTRYIYDENDAFFPYFPLSFQADFTFQLDEQGMHYTFTLTNLSNRQMPFGVCNHTAFKAPFVKGGSQRTIRIQLPVVKRCMFNERELPTGELRDLLPSDRQYLTSDKHAVKAPIDNEMYSIDTLTVDGKPFHGAIMTDLATNSRIFYEVDENFSFFVVWNDHGRKGYFCPEPMTWMVDAPNLDLPEEVTGYRELAPGESKTVTEHIYTK